jgi:hypothetical protein
VKCRLGSGSRLVKVANSREKAVGILGKTVFAASGDLGPVAVSNPTRYQTRFGEKARSSSSGGTDF